MINIPSFLASLSYFKGGNKKPSHGGKVDSKMNIAAFPASQGYTATRAAKLKAQLLDTLSLLADGVKRRKLHMADGTEHIA
ncbi:MAG: hypothetical protein Q8S19_06430 [Bacillota bacterium]|nr:hypothetical protein [Bacillota bacterium]